MLAALLAFAISACGTDSDNGSTQARTDSGSTTQSQSGQSKSDKSLPDDWPADLLPIPDGFSITTIVGAGSSVGSTMVLLQGPGDADLDALFDAYETRFTAAGFEITEDKREGDFVVSSTKTVDDGVQSAEVDSTGTVPGKLTQITLSWKYQIVE